VIYVYAVLPEEADLVEVSGLEDASVQRVDIVGLTLATSQHATEPAGTNEAVLRHAHVVDALATSTHLLPARFGTVFADRAALERETTARSPALRVALERVRACAEIGLRILSAEDHSGQEEHSPSPTGGADYLRARLREEKQRRLVAESLHGALARHARDSTRRPSAGGRLLLDAAYLVPAADVEEFRQEVGELGNSHPELALVCTGPWPPYSFAPEAA